MKSLTIFLLLLYWSIIFLAPVVGKEIKLLNLKNSVLPLEKPII